MSNEIDRRIVDMEFNNGQFEKGIKTSIKSLEAFQKSLKLDGSTKDLEAVEKAVKAFSFQHMMDGIEKLEQRFSAMGIFGMRVIERLSDKVINAGERMARSLSIDQVSAGFSKYEDKTKSVQTIVNATGKSVEQVNDSLNKLAWFTDETSYNFVDMVSNIGKFTSMNIDLEDAVTAMEGIATEAAVSGQGIAEASRAMYNFSQAIGTGSVKLMDWRSIENANMATAEFKQTIIDTAKELGILRKDGRTKKGTLVDFKNFSQTLSEGWFTSDVLIKSLKKYGEYADEIYKIASKEGITAAEAMAKFSNETMKLGEKAFKAAQEAKTFKDAIDATKDAVSTGWMNTFELIFGNYEEAKVLWTDLANALWEVFAAGAEDRNALLESWHDDQVAGRTMALKAIYSILSSIWSIVTVMKDAIGDVFPPATLQTLRNFSLELTGIATKLKTLTRITRKVVGYDIEEIEGAFDDLEGKIDGVFKRGSKGDGVKELQQRLIELGYDVGKAGVDGILGPDTEKALKKFEEDTGQTIDGIYDQTTHKSLIEALMDKRGGGKRAIEIYEEKLSPFLSRIRSITGGIAAVAHIAWRALSFVFQAAGKILSIFAPLGDAFLTIAGGIGDWLVGLDESIGKSEIFSTWLENLSAWLEPFSESIKNAANGILHFFGFGDDAENAGDQVNTFAGIWNRTKESLEKSGVIDKLKSAFDKVKTSAKNAWEKIKASFGEGTSSLGEKLGGWWDGFVDRLPSIIETVANAFANFLDWINPVIEKIPDAWEAIKNFLGDIGGKVWGFAQNIPTYLGNIGGFFVNLYNQFKNSEKAQGIWNSVKSFFSDMKTNLGSFFTDIWQKIIDFFSPNDGKDGGDAVAAAEDTERKLTIIERISNAFSTLWNGIVSFMGPAFDALAKFWQKYHLLIIIVGSVIGLLFVVFKFMSLASGMLKSIELIKNGRNAPKNTALKILEVAGAIALIAGSIWLLGSMDTNSLIRGSAVVAGIGIFILALVGLFGIMQKKGVRIGDIGRGLFELASAVAILAAVIFLISFVPWDRFWNGLGKVSLIVLLLGAFVFALNKLNAGRLNLRGLKEMAVAIAILAIVAFGARFISWGDILKVGLLSLFLAGLMAAAGFASKISKKSTVAINGLVKMALAIGVLAMIAKMLGEMDSGQFWQGMAGIAIIAGALGLLTLAMAKASKEADPKTMTLLVVELLASMWVFSELIKSMKDVNPGVMLAFAGSFAIAMLAMVAAIAIVNKLHIGVKDAAGDAAAIATAFDVIIVVVGALVVGVGALNTASDGWLLDQVESGGEVLRAIGSAIGGTFGDDFGAAAEAAAIILGATAILEKLGIKASDIDKGAAAIATAFDVMIVVVGALILGMGAWNEKSGGWVLDSIKSGGEVLQAVADAISGPFEGNLTAAMTAAGVILAACLAIGAIPGAALALIGGAGAVSLAFDILIAIIGGTLVGLGAINAMVDENGGSGKLVELINGGGEVLKAIGGALAQLASGFTDVIIKDIQSFADAIAQLRQSIDGMSAEVAEEGEEPPLVKDLNAALGLAGTLHEYFKTLTPYDFTEASGKVQGYATAASQLSTDIGLFAGGISSLRKAISGIADEETLTADTERATGIATIIHDFFVDIKPYNVIPGSLEGYYTAPAQLATDMTKFALSIRIFRNAVKGSASENLETDTTSAINSASQIHRFFQELSAEDALIETDLPFWQKLLGGESNLQKVINRMGEFGGTFADLRPDLGGLSEGTFSADVDVAIAVANRIVSMLQRLKKLEDEGQSLNTGDNSFAFLTKSLGDFGYAVGALRDSLTINNVDESSIKDFETITTGIWNAAKSIYALNNFVGPSTNGLSELGDMFAGIGGILESGVFENVDVESASKMLDGVVSAVESVQDTYKDRFDIVGQYVASGFAEGISKGESGAIQAAIDLATASINAAKTTLGEASPSKVFHTIGRFVDEGLANGITDNADTPESAMNLLANAIAADVDSGPVIRPIVDMSDVEKNANRIGDLVNQSGTIDMGSSIARRQASLISGSGRRNQNGSVTNTYTTNDDSVAVSGNTFIIRSDQDVRDLASELASLTKRQNRSMGAMA